MRLKLSSLRRVICEAIRQDVKSKNGPFKWNEFVKLAAEGDEEGGTSLPDRLQSAQWYAKWRLQKLGQGAARGAYLLNSKSVLKVALDAGGLDQNAQEVKVSSSTPADVPIARVLRSAPDNVWIVSELVRPVKGEEEFYQLSNYDVEDFRSILEEMKSDKAAGVRINKREYDEFVWQAWRAVEAGGLAIIDVANVDHWGVTADRRLVLLDYGYTDDMYDALPAFLKR